MISRFELLNKNDDLSMDEFKAKWHEHAAVEMKTANLKELNHTYITDHNQDHPLGRGPVEVDGYTERVFDDMYEMEQGVASVADELAESLKSFASGNKVLVCAKKFDTVVPEELKGQKLIKRMSFLGLKEGVTMAQFQHEWWGLHSDLVRKMPGYVGYAQNLVIDRLVDGKRVPYSELPVAGVVEFWYKDEEGFKACFAGEEFKTTAAHGCTFLGSVTTNMGGEENFEVK